MASVNIAPVESAFSSDALDLLDCFACEFDEVISRMAEHLAIARTTPGEEVVITADDIGNAAAELASVMKDSSLPADVKLEIDSMLECLSKKRQHGES